jgi:hypothetical protein
VVGKHIAQSKTPCWSRAPGNPCSIISGGGKWIDLTIEADPIYHTIPVAAEKAFCPAVKTGENQPWQTIRSLSTRASPERNIRPSSRVRLPPRGRSRSSFASRRARGFPRRTFISLSSHSSDFLKTPSKSPQPVFRFRDNREGTPCNPGFLGLPADSTLYSISVREHTIVMRHGGRAILTRAGRSTAN